MEFRVNLLPALLVDVRTSVLPDADEVFHLVDTTIVAILHLLPEGATTQGAVVPGQVMEPEQITLRTGGRAIVEGAVGL
jgi:hypothetical protein